MHPPMLYLGYVGLSATFAYAAAALITGDAERSWARAARPFMLVAWIALTLGITLGSWWAYYVLGWGGFWFWDPVENAALMPWLVATALLHSALATERTGAFRTWTLLLAIAAFSLSLIGTFLVRSGVLASVHAFANDPERGELILLMLAVAIGGALLLFAWRAPKLEGGAEFEPVSRETALLLNNVLLCFAATVVFFGTLYPLALQSLTGQRISVGAPYFAMLFAPAFVALLVLVPFGPRLSWRKDDLREALRILAPAGAAALVGGLIVAAFAMPRSLPRGGFFCAGVLGDRRQRDRRHTARTDAYAERQQSGLGARACRPRHLASGYRLDDGVAQRSDRCAGARTKPEGRGLRTAFRRRRTRQRTQLSGDARHHRCARGRPRYRHHHAGEAQLPRRRPGGQQHGDPHDGFSDLYVALGDDRGNGRWSIRAFVNPLAPFIWLGGALMAFGGLTSLWGRVRVRFVRLAPAE